MGNITLLQFCFSRSKQNYDTLESEIQTWNHVWDDDTINFHLYTRLFKYMYTNVKDKDGEWWHSYQNRKLLS